MKSIFRFVTLPALFLALTVSAHADTFTYDFLSVSALNDAFTYTSPVLITTDTTFVPDTCTIHGFACASVEINPPGGFITLFAQPGLPIASSSYQQLDPPAFTVGTHDLGLATLTITDNAVIPVIPEPSTLSLIFAGLIGAKSLLGRRKTV